MANNTTKSRFYQFYDENGKKFNVDANAFDSDMKGFSEAYPDVSMRMVDKNGGQWDIPVANVEKAMKEGGYRMWQGEQIHVTVPKKAQRQVSSQSAQVQQPRQATRPQTPRGFGQLNMDQARRPTFMSQKPTEEPIDVPQEESIVDKTQRQISGNATPEENRQVQNRMQQRMDEIAYEQETGKRMSQASDIPFTAPTLARDEYGNIRHNDDGNVLTGITTDEDRVSAHQQVVQEQKEWDALSDKEKRERMKQMQLQYEMNEYDEPGFLGVTGKKLASGFIKAGLGLLNGMQALASGMIVEDASSPTGYTKTQDYDPTDMTNNHVNRGLENANLYAERMSRQGEVRKGEGFTDLLLDGDIGGFLLKGWGSALESAPMTLSIYNPYTMALNAISMAGNNFRENTIENPDIPGWKRASMAIGSAAIEQAVEKFSDPVFKYFNGGKILSWFGKKGSEEATKKITKEAENTIARRIMNVLKDAGAEGMEEVATNFGNDALGQALDWMDGESDYGIVAQWRDLKKRNPNASLGDFAAQKARENLDSFFGGALGGAYMSGSAQITAQGYQYATGHTMSQEQMEANPNAPIHPATLDIAQSFDEGYTLDNEQAINDAKTNYETQRQRAIELFGEIKGLDSNPTKTLQTMQEGLNDGTATPELIQAAIDYVNSKATVDGIQQRIIEENRANRPNFIVNGNNIDEVDAEGNVITTHEYENDEEMRMGLWVLEATRDQNDMNADISIAKLNPKYDWEGIISSFADKTGMTTEEVEDMLNQDPLGRSEEGNQLVSEFANMLHGLLYDSSIVHEEQSAQDGATLADKMGIDLNNLSPEQTQESQDLLGALNTAQQALNEVFANNEDLAQEVRRMEQQGMPHEGIVSSLETFRPNEVQAVIDYYNAQAKFQGFMNQMAQKIDEEASTSRQRHTFMGTIDGVADLNNVHTITDGTNRYYLVSGDIITDPATGRITGSTSGLIIGMDLDGSLVQLNEADGYSLEPVTMSLDQFEEAERERLQQQVTMVVDPNQTMNLEAQQQQEVSKQPTRTALVANEDGSGSEGGGNTIGQAGAEASVNGGTGANETPATPVVSIESVTDKDGIKRYENGIPVDNAIADIQNDGFDVNEVADASIAEAQQTIDKIDKKPTKTRKDLMDKKNAQDVIDYYNNVKARWAEMNHSAESEENVNNQSEQPQIEEKPVVQQDTQQAESKASEAPEWRYDTPEAARERGYKVVEGHRIDRQEEKPMPKGMEVEVQYSTKDKVKGQLTVSELDDIQGSHLTNGQRNDKHFLNEAQPKAEFGTDRQVAAQTNASEANFRPELMLTFNGTQSAYSGSTSQTNRRGEIIQGNGRRNLAEYIYAPGNEAVAAKYKAYLMAHAEELGTTAEEISKMDKPFAHIVLDVNDEEAIRLGQFVAQDLESGGKKVPEVSTVTTKLGTRYSTLANIVLNHEDPDASLSERIEANAEAAVKWLNNAGVINATEAKTLLEDKALARQFIKDIITDQLFKDAHPDLRTMFFELPKNIQSAIISVVGREVTVSKDKGILKDIQEAIRAYHELVVSSPEFANAGGVNFEKRYAAVTAAVNDWLRQINMDGTVNSEKFGNFALELAKLFKSLKDQKTLACRLRDYYDLVTGATRELGMFDDNASTEPLSREEAIKQIFGIDYGRQRTVPLAGNNQSSEERREGSTSPVENNKREQEGTRSADNRGRDTGNAEVETPTTTEQADFGTETDPLSAIEQAAQEFREEQEKAVEQILEIAQKGKKKSEKQPSLEDVKEAAGIEETNVEPKAESNPSGNKLVTDERYEELKKRMRNKLLGQMNVGVDPEILAIGVEMAVYHIEKGARKFADYAKGMIEDLGNVIRPYLKAFYNGARDLPEMTELSKEMDDYETVQSFDVANFDKPVADPIEQAEEISDELKVEKDVQKAKENIKVVAKENKKKKNNISSQQQDLFNINFEEDDNVRRTDDERTEGLQTDGNIGEVNNGGNGEAAQQEPERPDGKREGERDKGLGDGLHDGLRPDDHVSEPKNQRNNRNERGKDYAPTSETARVKANIAAIKLLKQLENENRDATSEEMAVLKQYSGWGGLGGAFNELNPYYNDVRDVLDDAEYDSAAMSINSAYYTPTSVIDRLWDVAAKLGFKGGKILESSAGIGNIIASIPESMNERSDIEMVEIDSISGRILAKLYPDAKVDVQGFEDTKIENGSIDLAITNVPFVTGLKVRDEVDTDLSRQFGNIHDFVIAKNIRKLKEGGIGIFITTSNTLDKSDSLREWIDGKGDTDVMGVFRLNNGTFGGTNVTSDIIVVRKRVNGERHPDAIDVKKATVVRDGEYEDTNSKYDWKAGRYETKRATMRMNSYLNEHPENMGGEMAFNYEKGDTFRPGSYGLFPSEKNQEKLLDEWVKKMNNVFAAVTKQATQQEDTDVREGRMFVKDGKIYISQQGKAVAYTPKKAKVKGRSVEECVKDYVVIRESLGDVLKYQLEHEDDKGLQPLLDKLNKAYDNFVKKYGYLHKNVAISFLRDDIEFPDISALEEYSETKDIDGNKIVKTSKSKVFEGRVLRFKTEPKPQNIKDGVLSSVQQFGRINIPWMASVIPDQTESSIKAEILREGYGFEDPVTKKVEVRYEYLSGNVREKLRQAKENNIDGRYNKNIEELEKVVPMDIPAHLIDFSLGSSWIDPKLYEDFVKDKYGCTVRFVEVGGVWSMEVLRGEYDEKNRAGGVHSELLNDTIPASRLVEAAINNRTVTVQKTYKEWDGTKHTETDRAATQACQNRIGEIKDEFNEWAKGKMQNDVEMAEKMMRVYNDKFNSMVPKEVDDTFVPEHFDGAADYIKLYPHQSKAVMRAVTEPVMLAHQVGAGKTFTLITTAMEMRRLGTAKKPMIVVQNATVGQFVAAAKTLYPNAKILSLTEKDRDAEGRRNFYGKIKYNDWDIIVIPQSTFERIPDSPERQQEFIQEKIDDKLHALVAARNANADDRLIKQMERDIEDLEGEMADIALGKEPTKKKGKKKDEEKTKKNVEARAKEQLDRHADDVMYFDDMGIDALLIDEAHEYKRLGFSTTMTRGVKGIDPAGSKKAAGVYLKTRGILKNNGWKNVVFATGTPISNTAAEIWTFMKYLMPKEIMMEQEIWYFDDFVHNFGKVAQSLEFATNGKFKENTRFAAYINKPELVRIWSTVADTVLAKDMKEVEEKIPLRESGKDQDVFLPQTQSLIGIMRAVRRRLEEFEQMSGAEKRANSSIPLVMYGIAKRAAIDPRLVDAGAMDEPDSKTNKAVEEIMKDLKETERYKGTVAVFCDMQNGPEGFNIFQDMKRKLIEKGVNGDKIAIITSGMTIPQKESIFEKVNNGEIRVIMGSTQTLGTGVNIQERLHTLIHMDAPDRPMDYTQRNGRILRQGNFHKDWGIPVRILRFGVEDSLDVTSYQRLKTKSGFIDSIMDGKGALTNNQVDRTLEEDEEGLFDNPVAVLSGSQYALKKTQAERELRKWQSKRQQWEADQIYIENTLRRNEGQNKEAEGRIKEYDKQIELTKKYFPDGTAKTITIKGVETKTDEELQKALTEQVNKPIRERVDNARNDRTFKAVTVKIPMKFDDVEVNVEAKIERETEYVQGKGMKTTMHTTYRYNIPSLGIEEYSLERGFIKDIINDIKDDISAETAIEFKETAKKGIAKRTADNEQLEARRSPIFKDEDKLEAARKKVEEYTEEMRKEMAEKEAKYAAMDAKEVDLDSVEDVDEGETSNERRFDEDIEEGENKLNNKYKGESSQELFLSLSQKEGEDYYETVNELTQRVLSGRARLGREDKESRTRTLTPQLIGAEIISADRGGIPAAASVRKEHDADAPVRKQIEDAVESWAKSSDYWKSEDDIAKASYGGQMLTEGGENRIYLSEDRKTITKFNDPYKRSDGGLLKALRNIEVFNTLFPEAAYKVVGFARDKDGNFNIVMEQPFKEGKQYNLDPYFDEGIVDKVVEYFKKIGLDQAEDGVYTEFSNEKYYVQDVHYGNVVEQKDGSVVVIDANAKYNEQYKFNVYGKEGFAIEDVDAKRRYDEGKSKTEQQREYRSHIAKHIDNLVEKLGTKARTTVYHSFDELPADMKEYIREREKQGKKVRGWYENGQVYLYLPHIDSIYQAEKTIWHETVAHHGLRQLIGEENLNKLLKQLWLEHRDGEMGKWVTERMQQNGWALNEAIEEYIAREAEKNPFKEPGLWQRLRWMLADILHKMGFASDPTISDIQYLFWQSQNQLRDNDPMGQIKQQAFLFNLNKEAANTPYINMNATRPGDIENPDAEGAYDDGVRHSEETDEEVIERLEKEPKVKVYRAMQLIDGKLYPPMAAKQGGKLVKPIELGKWEKADEHPEMADNNGKFKLDKGNGKSLKAAYNPYIHTSTTMLNDQFSEAQSRPNLVVVEVEVPESELTSGYKAEKAKDAVGKLEWKAGIIQGQLTGTREVILSRWDKPIRIVPTEEVAKSIAEQIKGKVDVMPTNVVTPAQREALEKEGVKFVKTDNRGRITEGENKGETYSSIYGKNAGRRFDEDIDNPLDYSAKQVYNDRLNRVETVFSEAYQDAMVSLKTAQNAIAQDKDIPDSQNAYMAENLMHGKNKNEQDLFNRMFRDPLIATINKILNLTGMNWGDVDRYVYTKSGLERNRELYVRDWLESERNKRINKYEDLNAEEQDIYDGMAATIEDMFEDGDIDEAEKSKKLAQALQKAHQQHIDEIETEWHRVKDARYLDLKNGYSIELTIDSFTYADYLNALSDFILDNIDSDYKPEEHDYSGFRAMYGDEEGEYNEDAIIEELMNTEDAINGVDDVKTADTLWEQINAATKYALERYREAGMRSDEDIDRVEQMFHFYVPMRGFKAETGEDMYQYFTGKDKSKSYVGGLLKHAKGRGSEADFPISTIFAMSYKAIADCNQNLVNQKFYRLCQANPNDLVVLSDSWAVYDEIEGVWKESSPEIPEDATEDEVRQITLDWENNMRQLALEHKAKKITGNAKFDYKPMDKKNQSEHIVDVRINGQPKKMIVTSNPRMAQALNGQLRFEHGKNVFSRWNAAIKNFMASVFTSYSPTFALRNMARDWTHFRMMLGVREGHDYAAQANKYYRQSLFKMVGLFKKYRDGKLDESKEIERDFKDFMDNGGITGFVFMQKIDDIQKEMENIYKKQKAGKPIRLNNNLWEKILGAVESLNEGIENNARFATYRASRHYAGRTKARSAYDAKEITVNFNRKGAGSKTAGYKSQNKAAQDAAKAFGVTAQILGEGKIFFNATVQAIATTFKNFQNADGSLNKKYIAKWAAKYALPPFMFGMLLPLINKALAAALGGDDDDPYANLPEWTRRKNLCIYIGNGNFLTIPIGQELAAFLTLGDIVAGNTYASDLKPINRGWDDEILGVMNTFSPVDIDTKTTKGGLMEDPISEVTSRTFSVLAPLVAVEQNLGWTGRPIYKEDRFPNDKYKPEYQQVYQSTNPVLVGASKLLHEIGGGNDRARGKEWSEVNPAIIQYLWEQYTGGPGKVFSNTISIGKDAKDLFVEGEMPDFNIRKIEGLKAFVQQGDDRTQYYRTQAKFFKYQEDANKFKYDHDITKLRKQAKNDPVAKLELEKLSKTEEYQRFEIIEQANRSSKKEGKVGLDEFRKEIQNTTDRKEKRQKQRTYNELMKGYVDLLDEVGKE